MLTDQEKSVISIARAGEEVPIDINRHNIKLRSDARR